jgi:hypothetical protein
MEMTPRERFLATVAFEPVDRPYRQEAIGYWTETIKAEVMRVVPPMLEQGGYMPSIDHAVPADVSLENRKYFVELGRDKGERCCG